MLWTTCGQLLICSYSLLSRLFQDNSTAIGVSDALRAFALCGRVPVRCASVSKSGKWLAVLAPRRIVAVDTLAHTYTRVPRRRGKGPTYKT
jgi:hypothetical protein